MQLPFDYIGKTQIVPVHSAGPVEEDSWGSIPSPGPDPVQRYP